MSTAKSTAYTFLKQKDYFFVCFWHFQPFRLLCLERKHISGVTLIWLVWDYGLQLADFGYGCLVHLNDFSINRNNRLQWHSLSEGETKKLCLLKQKDSQEAGNLILLMKTEGIIRNTFTRQSSSFRTYCRGDFTKRSCWIFSPERICSSVNIPPL